MRRRAMAGLLLGLAALTGCGDDGASSAEVGDVVQGRLEEARGEELVVQVPTGQVRIVVGEGSDAVPADQAADGQRHDAPDGAVWVPLDWHVDPGAGLTSLQRIVMDDDEARAVLTVSAGGEEHALGDVTHTSATPSRTRTSGVVYVALPADETPVVTVDFEGVTTQVDSVTGDSIGPGVEALEGLAESSGECPEGRATGGTARVGCVRTVVSVPYLAGKGWSEDGWTVAQVETRVDTFEVGGATYAHSATTDASRLFGAGESTTSEVDARLSSLIARVVAEGSAHALEVVREVEGTKVDGDGPDTASVTWSARIPLR